MNLRKGLFSFVCIFLSVWLSAQQTTVFTEANLAYKRGLDFFNQGIYSLAQKEFDAAVLLLRPVNEPEWQAVRTDAELYRAKCAVRLDQPEAEVLVLDFLRDNAPSPEASQAALEIGDYYFNAKQYDKALLYYDMAPSGSGPARDEIRFKTGYAYFVTKKFGPAKSAFAGIKDNSRSQWFYPANYYFGCCAFYEGRYDEAAKAFQRCEQSEKYKTLIPYYLCQIYFAKKNYDQVISYGGGKVKDSNLRNLPEMNQLVGQAYYEKGEFKKALPYLEYAADNGVSLRKQDYYQLGYAQYQNAFYKQAIENFSQLNKQDSLLGQNALYHLGDCYLRTRNKFAARSAFAQAAGMNVDRTVREDALINYAKLSIELKYDRDALEALQRIPASSKHYEEAQSLMSDVFLNTRDYDRAIATLEGVKNRTPKLNETYQEVAFLRGLQLYQNSQKDEARRYFNKSLDYPINKQTAALCSYWLGTIANENGEYESSKKHISSFLAQAKSMSDLPEESNLNMGQYVQGYNYLKSQDYNGALTNFKACVDGLKRNLKSIDSEQIREGVLGDAILRAGDCHFKKNQYSDALTFYNEAVKQKYDGYEYALYQKAMIKGLQGSGVDKVVALEDFVEKFPDSRYADQALFQLGETYQDLGKLDKAIPPFKQLVADYRGKSPLINQALLRLGLITYNQGNTSAAVNYYKQVFSNNPEKEEAREALGALEEIYVKDLNKPDEYFSFLETVPGYKVSSSSKDSVVYNAALAQFNNGRFQQAIDGFSSYLKTYSNGPNALAAYYYRGESYASNDIKKYSTALKDYSMVVSKGHSKYYAKSCEKAALIAYNTEKDYAQAFEFGKKWEDAAGSSSGRFDAQVMVMKAAYQTENTVAVNTYAKKVIDSGVASDEQMALANYYLGKLAYDKGEYAKAASPLQNVTQLSDAEIMAESYHLLAQILYRQRKYTDAEELIGNANQASAGYDDWIARNLILLSDVYVAMDDKNSAVAALEAVLENYKGEDADILNSARQKYNKLTGSSSNPKINKKTNSEELDLDGDN